MKTVATFGVRCAAVFMVMAMVITMVPMNGIVQTAKASGVNGPATVDLGTAGDFVILAETGVSTTGTTKIVGDVGLSPYAATYLTGFSETLDSSNQFSTSSYVTGKLYASDYAKPTPAKLTTAVGDMGTAYTDAAGRPTPDQTNLGGGDITGKTLVPGLYWWNTDVDIYGAGVTLSGSANGVWILQMSGNLVVASTAHVNLTGGARAANIFWQVGGGAGATLGTTSVVNGNILAAKAIVLNTGAKLNGRALAQTAVTIDSNNVTIPSDLPISSVDPIIPYWHNTSPVIINATGSASSNWVKLYSRYSADNTTWKGWTMFGNDSTAPWSWNFNFPNGTGHYQFYSRAFVNATNNESAPGIFDQFCGYDNIAPTSSVNAMGTYWKNTGPVTIKATASDATSGIKNVILYYRFAADNSTWKAWNSLGVNLTAALSWSFTFTNGTGYYQFYTRARDNATNFENAPGAADQSCGYDITAPTSSVNAMGTYWKNSPLTVTATAADATSGVKNVTLYYKFATDNSTWKGLTAFGIALAAPWSWNFNFPNGTGYYQFNSRAHDNATNFQAAPGLFDQKCGYDITAPTSSVNAVGAYWKNTSPLTVTATATDATSGVKNVVLKYRYSADNATWDIWTTFSVDSVAPWSWNFNFPDGTGFYQFYTRGTDNATNYEIAPGTPDQIIGYDITAPTSHVNAMASYWKNTSPLTVTAIANDPTSGVKNVTLYYRYAADNSTWGAWTSFGVDLTAPWSWNFNFPNGTGYYQFSSRAHDNMDNIQATPGIADQICGYDYTAPTSGVDAMASYWKNTSPLTVTATAADDTSGSNDVTLYFRYSANNDTWGAWTSFGVDLAGSASWSFNFPNGTGYYEFYTLASDKAGNIEAAPSVADQIVGYDTTAPSSSVIAMASYWTITSPLVVTATAGDAMSGVKNVTLYYKYSADNTTWSAWTSFGVDLAAPWSWSFNFPSGSGYYEFYTRATDRADNIEAAPAAADVRHVYDNEKPVIGADTTPITATVGKTLTFNIAITDNIGVTAAKVVYRVGTGAWVNQSLTLIGSHLYALAITPTSLQSTQYYFYAVDPAGNWVISSTKTIAMSETTIPTVIILGPANGLVTNVVKATVHGTADDTIGTVATVEWSLNNATWTSCTGTTAWSCDVSLATGSNTVTIRATDSSGNKGFDAVMLNMDKTAPTLTIVGLADGSTVSSSKQTIIGSATDNTAVTKVEVSVNGGAWQTASGTDPWTYDATLKNGKNTIDVRTTDSAGNVAQQTRTVTYSNSPSGRGVFVQNYLTGLAVVAAVAIAVIAVWKGTEMSAAGKTKPGKAKEPEE